MDRTRDWRLWAVISAFIFVFGGVLLWRESYQPTSHDDISDATITRPPVEEVEVTVPEEPELKRTVRIGVVVSSEEEMPAYELLVPLAQGDINEYCMDEGLNCSFEFEIASGGEMGAVALQRTQDFKAQGIDLVMGYGWSSHICVSMSFIEANGMVQLSPASTSPSCARKDATFRLSPHDFKHAAPMVRMMRSLGVTDVVVIHRKDSWGDGLTESFKTGFEEDGGRVQAVIRYAIETKSPGFEPYLEEADAAIRMILEEHDPGNAAILLISFSEDSQILEQASGYPALMGVRWFGSEEAVNSSSILKTSRNIAVKVGMMSPIPTTADNSVYERVNRAFVDEFNMSLGYYDSNIYDCCWILALSVIEAGTDDGDVVRNVLPEVAANYSGSSGPCVLDVNGDREAIDYDYWGYFKTDDKFMILRCGTYHHDGDDVEWDETLMGKTQN